MTKSCVTYRRHANNPRLATVFKVYLDEGEKFMIRFKYIAIILLISLGLVACSSTPKTTQEQLMKQYPTLANLANALDQAKANHVDLLAPSSYNAAYEQYLEAHLAATSDQKAAAEKTTGQGQKTLQKAIKRSQTSKKLFTEVLEARNRAHISGGSQRYPKDMEKLDSGLTETAALVERGSVEKAKQRRLELQRGYSELELRALKDGTVSIANSAIENAKRANAPKLAPKTLASAEEELNLAQSVLEVDRTNRKKADTQAAQAAVLANRSAHIAKAVERYKARDFTEEDIVLAHQNDIAHLGKALGKTIQFDKPNDVTVKTLGTEIKSLADANIQHKQRIAALEAQMAQANQSHQEELARTKAKYTGELSVLGKSKEQLTRLQKEQSARFERVQSLFNNKEANIFRQKNNVLLSVHGFKFPSGSAEIRPENFALLNKVTKAISEFKNSKVVVSGHTDSTGTSTVNKVLSDVRAQNVAKFFTEVGGIEIRRLQATGFGQEKPIASNETYEGRALNRRVEILIIND